jgi:hypothetical protein
LPRRDEAADQIGIGMRHGCSSPGRRVALNLCLARPRV